MLTPSHKLPDPLTLKFLREEFNLTQRELARQLQLSRTAFEGYENGRRPVPAEVLIRIATRFGLTSKELGSLTVWAGTVSAPVPTPTTTTP